MVRQHAAEALGRKEAVPALKELLKDKDEDIRARAKATLKHVAPDEAAREGI